MSGQGSGAPPPMPPARGAVAGVKADLQRMKDGKYDPRGHGNAFTHNFLNQKPWHPMNFRNQITKWEAEQKQIKDQKAKEAALAEFEAEQESMKTLSYLSEEEQKRYRDRQSISFMYTKPPGLEAALAKEAAEAAAKAAPDAAGTQAGSSAAGTSGSGGGGGGGGSSKASLTPAQREAHERSVRERDKLREDPFAVMLTARNNLQKHDRFVLKPTATDGGAHGGFMQDDDNQRLLEPAEDPSTHPQQAVVVGGVVADAEDLALLQSLPEHERSEVLRRLHKMQKQAEKQKQLEEAQAVLRAAGYDVAALATGGGGGGGSKKRKKKKKKHKKGHGSDKKSKRRKESRESSRKRQRDSDSSSDSGSDSSDNDSSDSGR